MRRAADFTGLALRIATGEMHPNPRAPVNFDHIAQRLIARAPAPCMLGALDPVRDAPAVFNAARNGEFLRFISWAPPASCEEVQARLQTWADATGPMQSLVLSVRNAITQDWVSFVRLMPADPALGFGNAVEGGLCVHPRYWNSGIGTQLSRFVVTNLFAVSPTTAVVARVAVGNLGCRAMLRAAGFQEEGFTRLKAETGVEHNAVVLVLRHPLA